MMDFFRNDIIEFYCEEHFEGVIPEPVPAAKVIPDWFKKIKPTCGREKTGFKAMSAKKCMPLLDSMTYGYTILLQADMHVITNHDCSIIKAENLDGSFIKTVDRHAFKQVDSPSWPGFKQDPIKFLNNWLVKTKPGWSCLFLPPVNNLNLPFTTLAGIVDTDTYFNYVNFPAVWNVPNFDDVLPVGTPIVQVIPFKRQSMPAPNCKTFSPKQLKKMQKLHKKIASSTGVYKNECREVR